MVTQNKLFGAIFALALFLTFGATALAQQPQAAVPAPGAHTEQRAERMGKHRRMGEKGGMRLMRQLDLTDAQKEQLRAISERYGASLKAQREEMHKLRRQKAESALDANAEARAQTLRAELHNSMKRMRAEMVAILTPEQRTQLDQLEKERHARHGEMRERRRNRPTNFQ